ncbi:FAD-binding oxidoreductase (plasmid) [Bacillus megaterium]|nr:FAD-binding oxidoreductase [Priestia megaterium]
MRCFSDWWGIIGCSIAYYASKYGRDVTVIEKENSLVVHLHDAMVTF